MGGKSRRDHPDGLLMKAVVFEKYGLNELKISESVPKSAVRKPTDVLIKVHAAAINPIDKIRLTGGLKQVSPEVTWPALWGYDASGVVEQVGEEVTKLKVGDEVYVRLTSKAEGSLSEYCVEHVDKVALKPKNASFEEAAAMPLAAVTAMQAFERLGIKQGDKVFISGGAGGVGTFAIQIAKNVYKAHVATTASAGEKTDLVKSLGADVVVDYRSEKFEQVLKDYDFGFDTTNESHKICEILKKGGKVVTIAGSPSIDEMNNKFGQQGLLVRFFMFVIKNRKAESAAKKHGVDWSYLFLSPNAGDLETLASWTEENKVKSVLDMAVPFESFQQAVDKLVSGRAKGKCVIRVVE